VTAESFVLVLSRGAGLNRSARPWRGVELKSPKIPKQPREIKGFAGIGRQPDASKATKNRQNGTGGFSAIGLAVGITLSAMKDGRPATPLAAIAATAMLLALWSLAAPLLGNPTEDDAEEYEEEDEDEEEDEEDEDD
jgi:hypothetical protein